MQPVFVGGYLKCGTSVLASMLCSGNDVNPMIGEVVHLNGLVINYRVGLELFDLHSRDYYEDRAQLKEFCAAETVRFLEMTHARYGNPKFLVLKYPQMTRLFPFLHQLLPEAKFVISLRDPRDGVASAVVSQRKGAPEFANASAGQIAESLTEAYMRCLLCPETSFCEKTIYSKYECLVDDPAAAIKKLERFTGIDFTGVDPHDAPAQAGWAPDMEIQRQQPTFNELHGQAISSDRVGRYAETLNADEIAEVEQIGSYLLDIYRHDYSIFRIDTRLLDAKSARYDIVMTEVDE